MAASIAPPRGSSSFKRIIVCCDGTWMNALGKQGNWPPSNVTRISRVVKNTCHDGTNQVIMYHAGVGSNGSMLDSITGGDFGVGLAENIRELYNFICTNYVDGDDIVLVGFSRGAFTARSVADMIATMGLLTPDGLDHFYAIFEDYENIGDKRRPVDEFLFSGLAPYRGETGKVRIAWEEDRKVAYRRWLKGRKYTNDTFADGTTPITVKALAVWDTVGNLGIPPAPVIGIHGSARQWRFTHTQVSDKVENAFQALALDEPRAAFRPALWERAQGNRTNLKQVWFPGSHSNVGGGWPDEQISNITLAWMCDQLSSIGVEIDGDRLRAVFMDGLRYSAAHPFPHVPSSTPRALQAPPKPWGNRDVFYSASSSSSGGNGGSDWPPKRDEEDCTTKDHHPHGELAALWATARPWALGQTRYPTGVLQIALGTTVRRPGLFRRVDPETNTDTDEPLLETDERIHSSVRVRLACRGLGPDDRDVWIAKPLTEDDDEHAPLWQLAAAADDDELRARALAALSIEEGEEGEEDATEGIALYRVRPTDGRWQWRFVQPVGMSKEGDEQVPQATVLPEEPLVGMWERLLLSLTVGETDVWRYAESNPPFGLASSS